MRGWKIYGEFWNWSLKGRLFDKVENEMEEKMGGKKMKVRPTIFYLKLSKLFYQSNKEQITLVSLINYKKVK